jgi:hypothetical protein
MLLVLLLGITFLSSSNTYAQSPENSGHSYVGKRINKTKKNLKEANPKLLFGRTVAGYGLGEYCECGCYGPPMCYDGYQSCNATPGGEQSPGCGSGFRRTLLELMNLRERSGLLLLKRFGVIR